MLTLGTTQNCQMQFSTCCTCYKKTKDVLEIVLACVIQDDVCGSHRRIIDTEAMFLSYKKN